jgi:hypothetical protein
VRHTNTHVHTDTHSYLNSYTLAQFCFSIAGAATVLAVQELAPAAGYEALRSMKRQCLTMTVGPGKAVGQLNGKSMLAS